MRTSTLFPIVLLFSGLIIPHGQAIKHNNVEWTIIKPDKSVNTETQLRKIVKSYSPDSSKMHIGNKGKITITQFVKSEGEGKNKKFKQFYKVNAHFEPEYREYIFNLEDGQYHYNSRIVGSELENKTSKLYDGLITDYPEPWEAGSHYSLITAEFDKDTNLYLIAEYFYRGSIQFHSSTSNTNYSRTFYQSGDLLLMKISAKGDLLWAQKQKKQYVSKGDELNPAFGWAVIDNEASDHSYIWFINDKGVYVIYNTEGKDKEKSEKTGGGVQTDLSFFDKNNGAIQTQTIFTRKGEGTKLYFLPKKSWYLGDNKLLLVREQGRELQYGVLEILDN